MRGISQSHFSEHGQSGKGGRQFPASPRIARTIGLTLIELLAVMAIIALLFALAIPAFQSIAQGSSLARGGQMVADQLALGRQLAISRNGQVQVWFVQSPDGSSGFRGIQLWGQGTNVSHLVPLTRLIVLPDGVAMASNATLAPLLTEQTLTTISASAVFPGKGTLSYCGFRFKSSGGTDLPFNAANAFLSVVYARDGGSSTLPPNYCLVQVDPVTGRAKTYRP